MGEEAFFRFLVQVVLLSNYLPIIIPILVIISIGLFWLFISCLSAYVTFGLRTFKCIECGQSVEKEPRTVTDKLFSGLTSIYGIFITLLLTMVFDAFTAIIGYTIACILYMMLTDVERDQLCIQCNK